MKNIKLYIILLLGSLLVNISCGTFPIIPTPNNCKHIVEVNLEEIKGEMEIKGVTEIETAATYNLYNGSYSIDANFAIEKVGEEEYAISQLVNAEITNAVGYYIKYVEYCANLEELCIIVSNDGGRGSRSIKIESLKLDRTVKEVVVLEWDELMEDQLNDVNYNCKPFLEENKPESKRGSIIIGSK